MAHKTIALTTELKELDWLESAIIDKLDQVIQTRRQGGPKASRRKRTNRREEKRSNRR